MKKKLYKNKIEHKNRIQHRVSHVRSVDFLNPYHTNKFDEFGEQIDEVSVDLFKYYTNNCITLVRISIYGCDDFGVAREWPAKDLSEAEKMYDHIINMKLVSEKDLADLGFFMD